jgi:hypothetical protein
MDYGLRCCSKKSGECYGMVGGIDTAGCAKTDATLAGRPPADAIMTALCYHKITCKTDEMILRSHRVHCNKPIIQNGSI